MSVKRVLLVVLVLALLASLIVPIVAAGFGGPIDDSFVISDESTEELDPAVAYNSQQREYLVVFWNDRSGNDDIRAERVSWEGELLGGVWVSAGTGTERQYPDVAYNSARNEYLVVWEQYSTTGGAGQVDIYGQRLSVPTGPGHPQLQGSPFLIGPGTLFTADCLRPAVAYSSTSDGYLVVWQYGWGSYKIQGRVVLSGGTPSGSVFDLSSPTSWSQERPDLAYNRRLNGYLVVWQQKVGDYDIYGRIVHPSGTPVGPDSFTISSLAVWEETMPTVAAMPTATSMGAYLVVWESDDSVDGAIRYLLMTGDGTALDYGPVWWYTGGDYAISAVAANEDSRQFLIVMKLVADTTWAQAISIDLTQWGPWCAIDSGPGADHPVVASGPGGEFLVVFDRSPFSTRDIYGQFWGNRVYLPLVVRSK
jgi:hypothetical protein